MGYGAVRWDSAAKAILIRPIRNSDLEHLKATWEFGDDFEHGLVAVDENDRPVAFAAAWKRAEVHISMDGEWSTPGARLFLLKELHEAMRVDLRRKGFLQAMTWFEGVKDRFIHRLESWGWVKSKLTSWHKQL